MKNFLHGYFSPLTHADLHPLSFCYLIPLVDMTVWSYFRRIVDLSCPWLMGRRFYRSVKLFKNWSRKIWVFCRSFPFVDWTFSTLLRPRPLMRSFCRRFGRWRSLSGWFRNCPLVRVLGGRRGSRWWMGFMIDCLPIGICCWRRRCSFRWQWTTCHWESVSLHNTDCPLPWIGNCSILLKKVIWGSNWAI